MFNKYDINMMKIAQRQEIDYGVSYNTLFIGVKATRDVLFKGHDVSGGQSSIL